MLDLLKFDISARNRSGAALGDIKSDLRGIRGALATVNDHAKRAARGMRNVGAGLSAGVTAPLVLLGKQSVQLYDQQVRAETAVRQAILSTGGAAGKTLQDLKGLASGLQSLTTFGDEDILQNVTAPLLTFTQVQGEVFDRAQANVLDMATLLKMDLKSASLLVGKALNDPVKGLSALSRSGIQFSDDQKAVIKSLVETGQVAKAQGLILEELESQFGGQAAAAAGAPLGQWRQLQNAIGDVKEELGAAVVPFLEPLAERLKAAVAWFQKLSPEVKQNGVIVAGLAAAGGPLLLFLGAAVASLGTLTTALTAMGAAILANPIIAAIAAIAGGAYLIYRNWEAISAWFSGLWSRVAEGASTGWASIKAKVSEYAPDWLKTMWGGLHQWFSSTWNAVYGAFAFGWDSIKLLINGNYRPIELVYNVWRGVGDWFRGQGESWKSAFTDIWEKIREEISSWPTRFLEIGTEIVEGLKQGIEQKWADLKQSLSDLVSGLGTTTKKLLGINSPSRVFRAIGDGIGEGLQLGISDRKDGVLEEMRSLTGELIKEGEKSGAFMQTFGSGIQGLFKTLLTDASNFRSQLQSTLQGWGNQLLDQGIGMLFNAIMPFAKGGVVSGGRVQAFATGGVVDGAVGFAMRGGMGVMGEAGPEAIMPLTRVGGKLGVRAKGNSSPKRDRVDVFVHPSGEFDARVQGQATQVYAARESATVSRAVQEVYRASREVALT